MVKEDCKSKVDAFLNQIRSVWNTTDSITKEVLEGKKTEKDLGISMVKGGKIITKALDDLIKCECGPGQELKEIQLKIPWDKSPDVESTLQKAGYDVGTDAYYADPDKFVTVIVRPTKELELRSGGRSYG